MPAPSNAERVRAAKLRAKVKDGKTLTPADSAWLTAYEQNTMRASAAKAKPAAVVEAAAAATVRGPQLALDAGKLGPVATGVHVNTTQPTDDRIDPAATTWIPTMPEMPEGEPAPTGAPPPPKAGAPLVDEGTPAQGNGDPHAAEQFAGFIMALMHVGVGAGRELAADLEIPEQLREVIGNDTLKLHVIGHVGESAKRVALKYGFTSVPMADELTVAAAVVGSVGAVVAVQKRKRLKKGEPHAPQEQPQQATPQQPTDGLNGLWRSQ